jgi:hypothetical protein
MTDFGTVDTPDWPAIQRDLADRGVIPWYWGLTEDELAAEFARRAVDALERGHHAY